VATKIRPFSRIPTTKPFITLAPVNASHRHRRRQRRRRCSHSPTPHTEWEYLRRQLGDRVGEIWVRNQGARSFECANE